MILMRMWEGGAAHTVLFWRRAQDIHQQRVISSLRPSLPFCPIFLLYLTLDRAFVAAGFSRSGVRRREDSRGRYLARVTLSNFMFRRRTGEEIHLGVFSTREEYFGQSRVGRWERTKREKADVAKGCMANTTCSGRRLYSVPIL